MRLPRGFLILALVSAWAHAQEGGDAPSIQSAPAEGAPAQTAPAEPAAPAAPSAPVDTPKPAPAVDVKPNAPAETGGDYEIDYEEEDDSTESDEGDEPAPVKPAKKGKAAPKKAPATPRAAPAANDRFAPTSQGTRSKNRFAPLLKSEAKSVYKKNGKPLDVDTD